MSYFALVWKARAIEQYRKNYEREKFYSLEAGNVELPRKTLSQKLRHARYRFKKNIKRFFRSCCPENSALAHFFLYLRTDQTFPNFMLKSVLGFVGGIVLTYVFFMFFVFQLSISLAHATAMCALIGVLLTLGLAFSYRVRCLVFLLLPQLFSEVGRYTLLGYALILILTGPAKNTLHNSEVLSESMACGQEQLKSSVKQIQESITRPFRAMKETIQLMVESVKQVAERIKESLMAINRMVLSIVQAMQAPLSWLSSVATMCNKKMGTPSERCHRCLEDGVLDCRARLGPYFSWLCSVTYVGKVACHAAAVMDVMCVLVDFVGNTVVATIKRKLRTFSNHVKTMLFVSVHIHHSYSFSTNSSRSASQVAAGIVTEIRHRADRLLQWFSWMSCITSLFLLIIIFRAKYYQHMYESRVRYDNRYITRELRELDLRRAREFRDTVLPLNRRERAECVSTTSLRLVASERLSLARSAVFLAVTTFKLLVHMAADYSLYWVLVTIRYHGRFERPPMPAAPDGGVVVSGTGALAAMLRALAAALAAPLAPHPAVAPVSCLPDPSPPDTQRYMQIAFLIVLLWLFALLQPYGLRMRHVVMDQYRPERARARAVWLYNHILRKRGGFLKMARRKLHREYKIEEQLKDHFTFRQWLDSVIPCQTPGCGGVYCASCFDDIGQLCTACLSPVDYGDLSDISLEKGSSQDSSSETTASDSESLLEEEDCKNAPEWQTATNDDDDSSSPNTTKRTIMKLKKNLRNYEHYREQFLPENESPKDKMWKRFFKKRRSNNNSNTESENLKEVTKKRDLTENLINKATKDISSDEIVENTKSKKEINKHLIQNDDYFEDAKNEKFFKNKATTVFTFWTKRHLKNPLPCLTRNGVGNENTLSNLYSACPGNSCLKHKRKNKFKLAADIFTGCDCDERTRNKQCRQRHVKSHQNNCCSLNDSKDSILLMKKERNAFYKRYQKTNGKHVLPKKESHCRKGFCKRTFVSKAKRKFYEDDDDTSVDEEHESESDESFDYDNLGSCYCGDESEPEIVAKASSTQTDKPRQVIRFIPCPYIKKAEKRKLIKIKDQEAQTRVDFSPAQYHYTSSKIYDHEYKDECKCMNETQTNAQLNDMRSKAMKSNSRVIVEEKFRGDADDLQLDGNIMHDSENNKPFHWKQGDKYQLPMPDVNECINKGLQTVKTKKKRFVRKSRKKNSPLCVPQCPYRTSALAKDNIILEGANLCNQKCPYRLHALAKADLKTNAPTSSRKCMEINNACKSIRIESCSGSNYQLGKPLKFDETNMAEDCTCKYRAIISNLKTALCTNIEELFQKRLHRCVCKCNNAPTSAVCQSLDQSSEENIECQNTCEYPSNMSVYFKTSSIKDTQKRRFKRSSQLNSHENKEQPNRKLFFGKLQFKKLRRKSYKRKTRASVVVNKSQMVYISVPVNSKQTYKTIDIESTQQMPCEKPSKKHKQKKKNDRKNWYSEIYAREMGFEAVDEVASLNKLIVAYDTLNKQAAKSGERIKRIADQKSKLPRGPWAVEYSLPAALARPLCRCPMEVCTCGNRRPAEEDISHQFTAAVPARHLEAGELVSTRRSLTSLLRAVFMRRWRAAGRPQLAGRGGLLTRLDRAVRDATFKYRDKEKIRADCLARCHKYYSDSIADKKVLDFSYQDRIDELYETENERHFHRMVMRSDLRKKMVRVRGEDGLVKTRDEASLQDLTEDVCSDGWTRLGSTQSMVSPEFENDTVLVNVDPVCSKKKLGVQFTGVKSDSKSVEKRAEHETHVEIEMVPLNRAPEKKHLAAEWLEFATIEDSNSRKAKKILPPVRVLSFDSLRFGAVSVLRRVQRCAAGMLHAVGGGGRGGSSGSGGSEETVELQVTKACSPEAQDEEEEAVPPKLTYEQGMSPEGQEVVDALWKDTVMINACPDCKCPRTRTRKTKEIVCWPEEKRKTNASVQCNECQACKEHRWPRSTFKLTNTAIQCPSAIHDDNRYRKKTVLSDAESGRTVAFTRRRTVRIGTDTSHLPSPDHGESKKKHRSSEIPERGRNVHHRHTDERAQDRYLTTRQKRDREMGIKLHEKTPGASYDRMNYRMPDRGALYAGSQEKIIHKVKRNRDSNREKISQNKTISPRGTDRRIDERVPDKRINSRFDDYKLQTRKEEMVKVERRSRNSTGRDVGYRDTWCRDCVESRRRSHIDRILRQNAEHDRAITLFPARVSRSAPNCPHFVPDKSVDLDEAFETGSPMKNDELSLTESSNDEDDQNQFQPFKTSSPAEDNGRLNNNAITSEETSPIAQHYNCGFFKMLHESSASEQRQGSKHIPNAEENASCEEETHERSSTESQQDERAAQRQHSATSASGSPVKIVMQRSLFREKKLSDNIRKISPLKLRRRRRRRFGNSALYSYFRGKVSKLVVSQVNQ